MLCKWEVERPGVRLKRGGLVAFSFMAAPTCTTTPLQACRCRRMLDINKGVLEKCLKGHAVLCPTLEQALVSARKRWVRAMEAVREPLLLHGEQDCPCLVRSMIRRKLYGAHFPLSENGGPWGLFKG